MAILNQPINEGASGFEKKLEAGSESIVFDLLQSQQYQFPIPSAIRELTTNAGDSIREKQQFFDIISGRAKVSDFYAEIEGEIYKNSKYNPEYYDERWLSKTENKIKIIYRVNNNAQRDTFHIIDTGVGLGGSRLEGHFNPLYSSKRLSLNQVGKYGTGSKAGLALQTDYYSLVSRYNGMEFHFNVYDYKVDPTIPRMNMQSGKENPYYEMQTATELVKGKQQPKCIYYLPTDQPNGVEVILQAKKGLRKEFIDAVKAQLLYLDGIEFELHEEGQIIPQQVKATIEYEDDIFVLPTADSTYYSKPHLILNGICYGYISWLQLEEEERVGNIGIKVDPSAVDVNPNRESVRWTEKTRNAIHDVFKQGELIAEKLINEALVSTDIIDWLLKSAAAMGGANQNSIIGRFANIVDVKSMKPKFSPMPKIKFDRNPEYFFAGYDIELVQPEQRFSKSKQAHYPSLKRSPIITWQDFNNRQIYYQDDTTAFRKEMFLLSLQPQGFVRISYKGRNRDLREAKVFSKEEQELLKMTFDEWVSLTPDEKDKVWGLQNEKWKQDRELMDKLIQDSKFTELYSSVNVPESFSVYEKEDEEDTAEAVEKIVKDMTDAERRKLENKIVVQAFQSYDRGETFWRRKQEPRIKEILAEQETIIYGFQEDEQNLQLAFKLLSEDVSNTSWRDGHSAYTGQPVCMVAQQNAKYFKHHMYVDDFFMSYNSESKTISMHNKLVKWQTARKLDAGLKGLDFLTNFQLFDRKATELYRELKSYVSANYINLRSSNEVSDTVNTLENYADKVTEFQLFVAEHKGNDQAIAAKSRALFETDEDGSFKDAVGIEFEPYAKLQQLLEAVAPVQLFLNEVDCLTSVKTITFALEQEIKEYLDFKGYISLSNTASAPTLQVADTADLIEA